MKSIFKKFKIFTSLLAIYRRILFRVQKNELIKMFNNRNYPILNYNESLCQKYSINKLNVLWIGANENQDNIGFIDELSSLVNLKIFKNHLGFNQLYFDRKDISGCRSLNKERLLHYIGNSNIDIIMGQFWPELIDFSDFKLQEQLKNKSIRSICIAMDDYMPNRWIKDEYAIFAGPAGFGNLIDLYATSDLASVSFYSKLGLKSTYLPFGCSMSLKRALNRDIDVSFVGSNYGLRKNVINKLIRAGIKVNVYGPGFQNGAITAEQTIEIYNRSKIVLGISQVGYQVSHKNLKTRDFDVISSGALYLSNSCQELNAFFTPGYHYVKYDCVDDLVDKILFYLNNENFRLNISLAGQSHGLNNYLWRKNLEKILIMAH